MPKQTTLKTIEKQIDGLAALTVTEFRNQREYMDKRFNANDAEHRHFRARLDVIEKDAAKLREGHNTLFPQIQRIDDTLIELVKEVKSIRASVEKVVTREELEIVKERLARVEKHLGLA